MKDQRLKRYSRRKRRSYSSGTKRHGEPGVTNVEPGPRCLEEGQDPLAMLALFSQKSRCSRFRNMAWSWAHLMRLEPQRSNKKGWQRRIAADEAYRTCCYFHAFSSLGIVARANRVASEVTEEGLGG